jgi:hypothetical protein
MMTEIVANLDADHSPDFESHHWHLLDYVRANTLLFPLQVDLCSSSTSSPDLIPLLLWLGRILSTYH